MAFSFSRLSWRTPNAPNNLVFHRKPSLFPSQISPKLFHSTSISQARRRDNKANHKSRHEEDKEDKFRVSAYTTANAYNLKELEECMTRREDYREKNSWTDEKKQPVLYYKYTSGGEVFYFNDGMVCWQMTDKEERDRLAFLKPFEVESQARESEEMECIYRKTGKSDLVNDRFYVLRADIDHASTELEREKEREREQEDKLMFSYAMVRTTKLNQLEEKVDQAVDGAKYIPSELARHGKLGLSTTEINKKIGQIMDLKSIINLHSGLREEPDLCWDKPELEVLYVKAAKNFSIQKRVQVLNSKLDFVSEIAEALGTQANHNHSGFLEKIIIVLIAMELFFEVEERGFFVNYYLPYKRHEKSNEEH